MKKILIFILFGFLSWQQPSSAQNDSSNCQLLMQYFPYKECIVKDSSLLKMIDEALLEFDEEPEGDIYYPYSKSVVFRPSIFKTKETTSGYRVLITLDPIYYSMDDLLFQDEIDGGYMYAFVYKDLYFEMNLDLYKDSFEKKMFDKYFELTGNLIEVPFYTFYKGTGICLFEKKFRQSFIFEISKKGIIYGKEYSKEWDWFLEIYRD